MRDSPQATRPAERSEPRMGASAAGPSLVPGVALSELDSGATQQAYLLTLPDGRNFQLAAPLYHLATLLDGRRNSAEIAAALSARIGRPMAAAEVEEIVARKLAPLGILVPGDAQLAGPPVGAPPPVAPDAALGVLARLPLVPSRYLEPLTGAVKHLYAPALAIPILLLIAIAHVYAYQTLAPQLASFNPLSIPLGVFLLTVLILQGVTPWHELGHAAAARYFGARHGPMGVGFMGIALVAYVEVTDIWRLPRRQRLVVDLGGVYFQSMTLVLVALWSWATGDTSVLWIVLAMDFAMLMNLNPLFKLDGYWAVSDATGIPNLHQRVGEQLGQVVAGSVLQLARWARIRSLLASERLQRAAATSGSLSAFGTGARLALALYCILFLVSAAYFLLLLVFIVPMLILSYPLFALMAWQAVAVLLSGGGDAGTAVMILLQFGFVTLMLLALVGAIWPLALMATGRWRRPSGFGMDWPMQS